jgi:hypothetical protein
MGGDGRETKQRVSSTSGYEEIRIQGEQAEAASCHWHPILIRVVISRSTWNIYSASVEIMLGIGAECIKVYIIITYMGFPQLLLLPITKYSKQLLDLLF